MTGVTLPRAIVEQALEAMEHLHRTGDTQVFDLCYAPELIPALRAALAQQAEPVEPAAWMVYTLDGASVCVTDNPADFGEGHRALPLYIAPPQRTMVPLTEEGK